MCDKDLHPYVGDSFRERLDTFLYRHQPVVHGSKTALATILGLVVSIFLEKSVDRSQWIVITIVVVMTMMPNIGGVLQRSLYRLIATIIATLIALSVILISDYNPTAIMATLVIGVAGFTILAQSPKFRQIGVLCAVTLAIMLELDDPQERIIIWRGINIIIGVSIALLVTRFVFPIRASRQLRFHMAHTIQLLARLFTLAAADEETDELTYELIEDQISSGFIAQREALPLALLEQQRIRDAKPNLKRMMRCQRTILGLSRTLRRAYLHTTIGEQTIVALSGLEEVRSRIAEQLDQIAQCVRDGCVPVLDPNLSTAHAKLRRAMKQDILSMEQVTISPQAFTFVMGQIIRVTELLRKDTARVAKSSRFTPKDPPNDQSPTDDDNA